MQTWVAVQGSDIWQLITKSAVEKSDEDSAGGKAETNDFDDSLDTRAKKAAEHAVAEVRGEIESAGRYPVSVTAGTVPPEWVNRTIAIAAYRLATPKPGLLAVILNDGGMYSPLAKLYKEAMDGLQVLRAGGSFTLPSDPTGVDYQNEVSSTNPAIKGIRWGDSVASDDEYAAGVTEDGIVVSTLTNNMNTY